MNPSSRRIRAISTRIRLTGTLTVSWRAPAALRTRVSMSATESFGAPAPFGRTFLGAATFRGAGRSPRGSTGASLIALSCSSFVISPARFRHAGELAHKSALAEADPAEAELPHEGTGPSAHLAPVVGLDLVLRRPLRLQDEALLRHLPHLLGRRPERHAESAQQRAAFLVRPRRRHDRDLETAQPVDLVVVDLREDQLLLETEREVAPSVERAVRHALEVTDAR